MPAPSSGTSAIDAVFEMANEILGSMYPEEAEVYRAWLRAVRARVEIVRPRQMESEVDPTTAEAQRLRHRLATIGHPVTGHRRCSICRELGHKRSTCPDREGRKTVIDLTPEQSSE